jgi:uncharacterized membrane-anchored protein
MAFTSSRPLSPSARALLNKVPEVTFYFWVIKVLCTTVGETASDYLVTNLNLGLTNTTFITGALLLAVLVAQFRVRRYLPWVYWLGIVLISVVGTQITDNLTDNAGVSLVITTTVFSIVLAFVFLTWHRFEHTLSIHTITSTRREAFYWLTVLFTFALGTAAGDLVAERLNLGYWISALLFAAVIAAVAIAHFRFKLNAVAAFWVAYVLTRPLGASLGDYLSQPRRDGGLGLGTTITSILFLGAILLVVLYLSLTRADATEGGDSVHAIDRILVVAHATAAAPALLHAIRERAARGPATFHLLVPRAAQATGHAHPEQEGHDAEHILERALPLIGTASGTAAEGSLSTRHDPIEAIEEALQRDHFSEVIFSTLPRGVSRWLHADVHRLSRLGLPVTTVTAHVLSGPAETAAQPSSA